jgi:kynurenine formamidase
VGTQLNGIGHIGIDHVYYNGNKAADFVTVEGVKKLGIEKVPPIVTRGVVLDMTAHFKQAIVPGGTEFKVKDIEAVLEKQGITLRKGDVVLFNTGWLELIGKDNKQFLEVEPGIGMEAAQWLADKGIVAFGGDTWASEVYPNPNGKEEFPVNQYMLTKRGIYNLELIDSRALVRDKAWEFLFVLGQPLYVGSTQVNVNPVAIRGRAQSRTPRAAVVGSVARPAIEPRATRTSMRFYRRGQFCTERVNQEAGGGTSKRVR